ncbi:MAG: DUF1573 domain-containing protein [Planctomycetaceae bacterium]|nr:DUF1573 domain-containing protein [Planctomycetaceae bacterium]
MTYVEQGELPNKTVDIGEIESGTIDVDVVVTNDSANPVQMTHSVRSCTCASVDIPSEPVQPAESVTLHCRWNVSETRGAADTNFAVFYNVEGKTLPLFFKVNVHGKIKSPFDFEPEVLEFVKNVEEVKAVKLLSREADGNIAIASVTSSSSAFEVEKITDKEIRVKFIPNEWIDDPALKPSIVVTMDIPSEMPIVIPIVFSKMSN